MMIFFAEQINWHDHNPTVKNNVMSKEHWIEVDLILYCRHAYKRGLMCLVVDTFLFMLLLMPFLTVPKIEKKNKSKFIAPYEY